MRKAFFQFDIDLPKLFSDLAAATTLNERLAIMYPVTGEAGMFGEVILVVKGHQHDDVYGVDIINPHRASTVGNFLLSKHLEPRFNLALINFQTRLNTKCPTIEQKKALIDAELDKIQSDLKKGSSQHDQETAAYCEGYSSESRKVTPNFPLPLTREIYDEIVEGIISRRIEMFLKGELGNLNTQLRVVNTDTGTAVPVNRRKDNDPKKYKANKSITIDNKAIKALTIDLHPYLEGENNKERFLQLISGDDIGNQKVEFSGNAQMLCRAFHALHNEKFINGTKTYITSWLLKYFLYSSKGKFKELKASTVGTHFKHGHSIVPEELTMLTRLIGLKSKR